jgi:ABC-2 type transport system ATP-binding protein
MNLNSIVSPGAAATTGPRSSASADLALELRGVTKYFGEFKAVSDLSFALERGAIRGFLGPNGAGKTTTIRMILDIFKPSSGEIRVLGRPSALDVRDQIGYLPEEKGLYKKMKAWAVIAYFATLKGMPRKAARIRAHELLERFGLADFADKPTDALSKGMGQKVQVLASIAHDPEFVILDEPFSGLDPVNQQVMEEIIRDMAARGRAVLFSTHVMEHAERLCERILLIAKGRKIFDGEVSEAKALLPRRVRIEAESDIGAAPELAGLAEIHKLEGGPGMWELRLHPGADPQAILQICFARGVRLRGFSQHDPSLHEVFVKLVGSEAKEATFR